MIKLTCFTNDETEALKPGWERMGPVLSLE